MLKPDDHQEELHEDLADYINDFSAGMKCIQHPLVYSVPYGGTGWENNLLNQQLKCKREQLDKANEEGDIDRYVFLHERPHRLQAFIEKFEGDRIEGDMARLLANIWTDSENIYQNIDTWQELFKITEPKDFMTKPEYSRLKRIFGNKIVLVVWRGGDYDGMSYTINKAKAKWFAKRFGGAGTIRRKEVTIDQVFAYTSARSEGEIILKEESDEHSFIPQR